MATIKSANVTKYDAGGSGDNYIPDGYIKSVEKVWIDTYSVTGAITTTSSLLIARVPKGKKITDIVVHLPVLSAGATSSTVYCCTGATTAVTTYFGTLNGTTTLAAVVTNTISTVRLNATVALTELAADTGIYIMINPATAVTGGTIRSIVKYT